MKAVEAVSGQISTLREARHADGAVYSFWNTQNAIRSLRKIKTWQSNDQVDL